MRTTPADLLIMTGTLCVVVAAVLYADLPLPSLLPAIVAVMAAFGLAWGASRGVEKARMLKEQPWWVTPAGIVVTILAFPVGLALWDDLFPTRDETKAKADK